jgi:hypothetical protein
MRIEIVLIIIVAAVVLNIYTDGKLLKYVLSHKKYYQMAGVVVAAVVFYWVVKRNPDNLKGVVLSTNEYLKYMPVDRNTSDMINPILDFTKKYVGSSGGTSDKTIAYAESRLLQSGQPNQIHGEQSYSIPAVKATKRSVSETKKKYVAAQQNWRCGNCGKQLPAWFEVDHKVRLEYGGSNHIDNLVALCRDCHGEKTSMENL